MFDFAGGDVPWQPIDDAVMGGESASEMQVGDGIAVFRGAVSLARGGGFASVRSSPAQHRLAGFDGIALRLRGDGKTYQVRLRTTTAFDGPSYRAKVQTEPGSWLEVRLPFDSFEPVFRGRPLPGHPALDPAAIRTFGFLIADRQSGPFRLEIDRITAYRNDRVAPRTPA